MIYMIVDFSKVLKNLNGDNLKDETGDITLKSICVNSLLATIPNETPTGEEKLLRYSLATQINKDEEVDLSAEDISKIKKMVGQAFPTVIVGQTFLMLEGKL